MVGRRWHCPGCLRSAGHGRAPSAGAGQGQMGALERGLGREPGAAGQGSPLPVRVLAEHGRVTHHDQQSLGPGDGHVEPLRREKRELSPAAAPLGPFPAPPRHRQLWCGAEHPAQLCCPWGTGPERGCSGEHGTLGFLRKPSLKVWSSWRYSLQLRTVEMRMTRRSWPWNCSTEPTWGGDSK